APIANTVSRSGIGRWVNEQLLGIDRRRTPPAYTRCTFATRFASRVTRPLSPSAQSPVPAVVLFNDTFTNFNHPEIGVAAADVLDAAGVGVRLAPHGCCGRPLISQGLLA